MPDNWRDYYPSEAAGRGDSWLAVKFGKGGRLDKNAPREPYVPAPKDHTSVEYGDWLSKYGGPFTGKRGAGETWAMNNRSPSGQPGPDWDLRRSPPGAPTKEEWFRQHPDPMAGQGAPGRSPAPPARAGTPIHQPGQPPPAGYGRAGQQAPSGTAAAAKPPPTNEQLGKWFATMKPGATMELQGKKYFKNQNGAVVDVTDPRARKRITDRQGKFIGQAAAPPPATTPPGTTAPGTPAANPPGRVPIGAQPPPPAAAPPPILPPETQAEYPPTNQPPYQYDPYSMNQFGYPQGQGPGPYGWNPGYGGPPFNYSNFSNSLMQGMGGGGGFQNDLMFMPSGYGGGMMPQMQDFMQGFGGGYGGGYDPYGGMGFDSNMMAQGMMGYF